MGEGNEELRVLLDSSNENHKDASVHYRLALTYDRVGRKEESLHHARLTLKYLRKGLEAELMGGQRDPIFGLDSFVDSEQERIRVLFGRDEVRVVDATFRSIMNVNELRTTRYSDSLTWQEHVRPILAKFTTIEDIAEASARLLQQTKHEESGETLITKESLSFLKRCIETPPGISAEDIGDAIEFYQRGERAFMPTSNARHEENLVAYFLHLRRYSAECAVVFKYWMDRSIRGCIRHVQERSLMYILGDKADNLEQQLAQLAQHDYEARDAILKQMVSQILERNKLKIRFGMNQYYELIQRILRNEFFNKLLQQGEITLEQYNAIIAFKREFGPHMIPVRERENQVVSLNDTYIVNVRLGNAGMINAFVKLTPERRAEFMRREQYIFENCRARLEERGVTLPHYEVADKCGDCHVMIFSFINGHNLYHLINNHRAFNCERPNTDLEQSMPIASKTQLLRDAIAQLASIQVVLKDVNAEQEHEANPQFRLRRIGRDSRFFTEQLEEGFGENNRTVTPERYKRVTTAFAPLNKILVDLSIEDPVYYKDSNPRNIMVRSGVIPIAAVNIVALNKQPAPIHIDYEYGDLILGECDLVKLCENGRDYLRFDVGMNYNAADRKGIDVAREYLQSLRYLSESEELEVIEAYNVARGRTFDERALTRYRMSAAYIHTWYVAWFSHKIEEDNISDSTRRIIANRFNYHLLEAKVALDALNEPSFGELRNSLDEIAMIELK